MPYILLKGEFTETIEILPLVKECLQGSKSDEECKIISYQLISFMQLVFTEQMNLNSLVILILILKKKEISLLIFN